MKKQMIVKGGCECSGPERKAPIEQAAEETKIMDTLDLAAAIGDRIAARMEARFQVIPTLTLDQAAAALGLSNEKVRQLCNGGKIPFIRVDKFYRIKPGDINAYLERNYCTESRV